MFSTFLTLRILRGCFFGYLSKGIAMIIYLVSLSTYVTPHLILGTITANIFPFVCS